MSFAQKNFKPLKHPTLKEKLHSVTPLVAKDELRSKAKQAVYRIESNLRVNGIDHFFMVGRNLGMRPIPKAHIHKLIAEPLKYGDCTQVEDPKAWCLRFWSENYDRLDFYVFLREERYGNISKEQAHRYLDAILCASEWCKIWNR